MKKQYFTPEMKAVEIGNADLICTSVDSYQTATYTEETFEWS